MFETTKESLATLLDDAAAGRLQLPDFQRGWVWDDYGIRSLLASVSQSFPIGAVMTLQNGGEVRFRPRLVEGVPEAGTTDGPERLILDGQQRLTSLFQACRLDKPVETQNEQRRRIQRWYYIDMRKALDPTVDREEAILSVPRERRVTRDFGREFVLDVSTPEKEFDQLLFPANRLYNPDQWEDGFRDYWDDDRDQSRLYRTFRNTIIDSFRHYQLPVISLRKETSRDAVCLVFEKVNTGGKKLDAFELLTAIYAAAEFNLRDDWLGNQREGVEGRLPRLARFDVLKQIQSTDFLQAISLLHTSDEREAARARGVTNPKDLPPVSCQRKAILNLPLTAYQRYAADVEEGFRKAARFLTLQKVFWHKDVPYQSQLVPLAAILVRLGDRWEQLQARDYLARWFWCGVFGELYGSAVETRFAKDFIEVPQWIDGGREPTTIIDSNFSPDRLRTLRSRLSAAYKGFNALLKLEGGRDFRSGQPIEYSTFWEESVDIHHIFPKNWCEKRGIQRADYDSIVNKSPLSARTNRIISNRAPSVYLPALEQEAGITNERMDELLASHWIEPQTLRSDDFEAFIATRSEALLRLVEEATGKALPREQAPLEGEDIADDVADVLDSIEADAPLETTPEAGKARVYA